MEKAKQVQPSERGELEISTLNQMYLDEARLKVKTVGRGYTWLDTGTHESMLAASNFIQTIEDRQGLKVACVEEIAYEMGYISKEQLLKLAQPLKKNQYGQYLIKRAKERVVPRCNLLVQILRILSSVNRLYMAITEATLLRLFAKINCLTS